MTQGANDPSVLTLYFDEAGWTGYNLLDSEQPIFVVSSTDVTPDKANEILQTCFPRYQGDEFKFSRIWNSNHRSGLLQFAQAIAQERIRAFSWMTDKRFAVLSKMVDFLVEPAVTQAGYDFYADGFCWKYVNYIHFGLREFAEPELYESMIDVYHAFSRSPSPDTLHALQYRLAVMAASTEGPIQTFLDQMSMGANIFERFHDLGTFNGSNELHVTSVLAAITHWRKLCCEDIAVVHDASAHFFRHQEMWSIITGPTAPQGFHELGDGTEVEFPLRVVSTLPDDSKDNRSVQFCDILAGVTAKIFDSRIIGDDRTFLDSLIENGLAETEYNGVRPSAIFPDQIPPRPLEGPDAVDRMMEVMFRDNTD